MKTLFKIIIFALSFIASIRLTALQPAVQAGRRGLTQFGQYSRGLTAVRPSMLSTREYSAPNRTELSTRNWKRELADVAYLYSNYGIEGIEALPLERLRYLNEFLSTQNPESGLTQLVQQAYTRKQGIQTPQIAELLGVPAYSELSPELKAEIISRIPRERGLALYQPTGLADILPSEKTEEVAKDETVEAYPTPQLGYISAIGYITLGLLTSAVINYIKETYDDTPKAQRKIAGLEQLQQYPELHQALVDYILTQLNIPPADFEGKTPEEIVQIISEKSQFLGTNFFELYSQLVEQWFNQYVSTARILYNISSEQLSDEQIISQEFADKAYKALNEVVFKPLAMHNKLPNETETIYLADWLYWSWINSGSNIIDFVKMQQNPAELALKIDNWKKNWKTRARYNSYYYWYGPQAANDWLEYRIAVDFPNSKEAILDRIKILSTAFSLQFTTQEI